jgi:hypothetical protein
MLHESVALFEAAVELAERGLPALDSDLFLFYEQLADAYGTFFQRRVAPCTPIII